MEEIDQEQISEWAYRLWQERGCPPGSPDEDWFRAEAELRLVRLPAAPARRQARAKKAVKGRAASG